MPAPDTLAVGGGDGVGYQRLAMRDDPWHIFAHGDIGDAELVSRLLHTYQPTAIVNFAAESHVDRSIDGPQQFLHTNVVGTFELLSAVYSY
jgi:dTDP-glucose 4,6-dehydratase